MTEMMCHRASETEKYIPQAPDEGLRAYLQASRENLFIKSSTSNNNNTFVLHTLVVVDVHSPS